MPVDNRDFPEGYPGPPPGADPNGSWTGGGKWRPWTWVPDAPPPPDPVPDPEPDGGVPKPRPTINYDWTGQQTTRPAPGGFSSWKEYNGWRAALREGTLGGAYSIPNRPGMPARHRGDPDGRPAGADRVFGRDPSDLQDQLTRDRLRMLGPNANYTPPTVPTKGPAQRNSAIPAPVVLPSARESIMAGPMQMQPAAVASLLDLLNAYQPMQPVQPVNPLQVLLARLGVI